MGECMGGVVELESRLQSYEAFKLYCPQSHHSRVTKNDDDDDDDGDDDL